MKSSLTPAEKQSAVTDALAACDGSLEQIKLTLSILSASVSTSEASGGEISPREVITQLWVERLGFKKSDAFPALLDKIPSQRVDELRIQLMQLLEKSDYDANPIVVIAALLLRDLETKYTTTRNLNSFINELNVLKGFRLSCFNTPRIYDLNKNGLIKFRNSPDGFLRFSLTEESWENVKSIIDQNLNASSQPSNTSPQPDAVPQPDSIPEPTPAAATKKYPYVDASKTPHTAYAAKCDILELSEDRVKKLVELETAIRSQPTHSPYTALLVIAYLSIEYNERDDYDSSCIRREGKELTGRRLIFSEPTKTRLIREDLVEVITPYKYHRDWKLTEKGWEKVEEILQEKQEARER